MSVAGTQDRALIHVPAAAVLVRDWIQAERAAQSAWTQWCDAKLQYVRGAAAPSPCMEQRAQELRERAEALRREAFAAVECECRAAALVRRQCSPQGLR